jgi:excisionase family DNA binding protein
MKNTSPASKLRSVPESHRPNAAASHPPIGALPRKDAANYLGVSTRYLDKLAADGQIQRAKFGSKTVYPIPELDRLLQSKLQRTEVD